MGRCNKNRVLGFFIVVNEGSLVMFPVLCFDLPVAKRTILQFNIPSFLSFASIEIVI